MPSETLTFTSGKALLLTDHSVFTLERGKSLELHRGAAISTLHEGTLHDMNIAGTLLAAGTIEANNLTVLADGRLIISKPMEVTGNLIAAPGSLVMIGFRVPPPPIPHGHENLVMIGFRVPPPPIPHGHGKNPDNLTDYYLSAESVVLYSNYFDVPLEETRKYFATFMRCDQTVFEVTSDGMLKETDRFGITGAELVALGLRVPPPPKPGGYGPAITAKNIVLQNGSNLNFSFDRGYAPTRGDMIVLTNVPMQIGKNARCNLAPGWVVMNSGVATGQYIGV